MTTYQSKRDELPEPIKRILQFNCPNGCDGNGSYPELGADGECEQGQCQWCFEFGMPLKESIDQLVQTEVRKELVNIIEFPGTLTDEVTRRLLKDRLAQLNKENKDE